jgi:hypothetical protein
MEDQISKSVVEKVFPDPDTVCQGEYWAMYEFFLSPDMENDPDLIMGCLEEFVGWANHLKDLMQKAGYGDQTTA